MNLEQVAGQEMEWRQAEATRRFYRLTLGEREIASLRFESSYGTRGAAECGFSQWTFKRTGFLSPKITVREPGSESDLAVFTPGWTGRGWVVFNSGRRYRLRHTDFWGSQWVFETADGAAAVTLGAIHGFFKQGGAAMVSPSAAGLPEAPVLLLLIWYVRLLMHADAEAGAVVAAVG
ncbi:MAG: hypothetical protein ACLP59_13650 [Bryobacteraceae bacterium]